MLRLTGDAAASKVETSFRRSRHAASLVCRLSEGDVLNADDSLCLYRPAGRYAMNERYRYIMTLFVTPCTLGSTLDRPVGTRCLNEGTCGGNVRQPAVGRAVIAKIGGHTLHVVQTVTVHEHVLVATRCQFGSGQHGSRLQAAAAEEHHRVAVVSQRGCRQFGRVLQAGTLPEHVVVAQIGQLGGGQRRSIDKTAAELEHTLVAL